MKELRCICLNGPNSLLVLTSLAVGIIIGNILTAARSNVTQITEPAAMVDNMNNHSFPRAKNDTTQHVIIDVLRKMAKGFRYAQSSKTIFELSTGFSQLNKLLKEVYDDEITENLTNLYQNPISYSGVDVCPEKWLGSSLEGGSPNFINISNRVETNCSLAKPDLQSLFTIVVTTKGTGTTEKSVQHLVDQIYKTFDHVKLIIATSSAKLTSKYASTNNSITVLLLPESQVSADKGVPGTDINNLIGRVTTKYTLVGRQLVDFDFSAKIDRVIRFLDHLNASVVGFGHQNVTGHWKLDCYTTVMRNYQYRLVEGYDISYNSCAYCDYIGGPFMARTDLLKNLKFNTNMTDEFIYIDFFERLKGYIKNENLVMICPDAMVTTQTLSQVHSYSHDQWMPFMRSWDVQKIIPPRPEHEILQLNGTDSDHGLLRSFNLLSKLIG